MADATATKIDTKIEEAKAEVLAEKAYAAAATEAKAAPAAAKKTVAAKKVAPVAKKPVVAKKPMTKKVAKPAAKKVVKAAPLKIKDTTIMAKTQQQAAEDFTAKVKDAVADLQDRAKTAFEKSNAVFADAGEFTKGNVEALVESGKILAAGLQDMGKEYVAEGKTSLETVTADVKELAQVKSPVDFFKLQGEILRRNFDAAVASSSKHSEMALKLANDAFAPISTRVSLAVEKVKQAA